MKPRPPEKTGPQETPVAALKAQPRNPRTIRPDRLEQLKRNLEADREMLLARPLIALPDGTVIAGNQRLRAAQELGWETIPVVTVDLDEDRAALWALRDNRAFGEDDHDLTAELLRELDGRGVPLDLTGFAREDLEALLLATNGAGRTDPDDAPPVPAEPRSERGAVYELGPHRVMCGDATDPEDLRSVAGDVLAEVLWTDPPWGVDYVGKTGSALRITGDDPTGTRQLLQDAFAAAPPVCVESCPFYVASPAGNMGLEFRLAVQAAGWRFEQTLVWVKQTMVLGRMDYHWRHEDVLYGHLPGTLAVARMGGGERWWGGNDQDTIFVVDRPHRSSEHPTMKPVELVDAHLRSSSQFGGYVLDPFAGSGSTLIAAEQLGRRALLVEIDPAYVDVIRQRYADFTGQPELAP